MPKRDFRSVNAKDTRAATRRSPRRNDFIAWQKAQFHKPTRDILGQFEMVENTALSHGEVGKRLYGWSGTESRTRALHSKTHKDIRPV